MSKMGGWSGLFGSRSPKLKADPRIRWLGKLPTYADYYSSRNDEKWTAEFNDWILEGFELYLNRARALPNGNASPKPTGGVPRLPLSGAAVRLPKSAMTVFTALHDYGGDMVGRPFPLCFYAGVPSAQWPGPTHERIAPAARVLRDLISLRGEVSRYFNAPGGFATTFGNREVEMGGFETDAPDTAWLTGASALSMNSWFDRARPDVEAESLNAWLDSVGRWGRRIAASESNDFSPTLSFPLAPGVDLALQTAGWLRWLEARMDVRRRTLSLFLTVAGNDDARRFMVLAHPPTTEDFLLLTPLAGTLRYVDDLSKQCAPDESSEPAATGGRPADPATWAEFTQNATGGK